MKEIWEIGGIIKTLVKPSRLCQTDSCEMINFEKEFPDKERSWLRYYWVPMWECREKRCF